MSLPSDFFIAGGTLRAQTPSYVMRPADQELFEHTLAGEFCYVLTPRQMGKSSLMIRTARRLAEAGRTVVILDLTGIGSGSADQWYQGLLEQIARDLQLNMDVPNWWQERASLTIPQRFSDFLRDVVLQEIAGSIVIFIDEIDSTLNFDFRDDFFAAIRAIYNARATESTYKRLTFALLGVATPTDLIKDRERTPFNIGRRIVLQEFSYGEAESLKDGLEGCHPGQGQVILRRIFDWTSGYPYLTQKLCLAAAEWPAAHWDAAQIDELVEATFFSDAGRKDPNFKFVQQRIQNSSAAARRQMLNLYRKVYSGKSVPDDDRSHGQNYLELYGLVRVGSGKLNIRNDIYRRIFDQKWIEANKPANRDLRLAIGASLAALLVIIAVVVKIAQSPSPSTSLYVKQFNDNAFPTARIEALAGLFRLSDDQEGLTLFYNLDPYDQLDLFSQENARSRSQEMVVAIRRISLTLDTQDPNDQAIMGEMMTALRAANQSGTDSLVEEIRNWKMGRELTDKRQYPAAIDAYSVTIALNPDNPAAHYDRASAHVALGEYAEALSDLDQIVGIAVAIPPTATPELLRTDTATTLSAGTSGIAPSTIPLGALTPTITTLANDQPTIVARASAPAPTTAVTITATAGLPGRIGERDVSRLRFINRETIIETVVEMIKADPQLLDALSSDSGTYPRLATLATQLGLSLPASGSAQAAGKLVYADDFSDPAKSGLENLPAATDFQRGFHSPGVYHMLILNPNDARVELFPRRAYQNFRVQNDLSDNSDDITAGDDFQGMVLRVRDSEHFYAVLINSRKQQYAVHKADGRDNINELIGWKTSPLIKADREINQLRIDAAGDTFKIYVNGMLLDQFSDTSYASGMVGMIVLNFDAVMPHIHFDNLKIWSNDPPSPASSQPSVRKDATGDMVLIPGGEFILGSNVNLTEPPQMLQLPDFYIDRTEVTNAIYRECVTAGKCTPPLSPASEAHPEYTNQPQFDAYPVINVSWQQAITFCAWAGKRLPTEAEWEKAASWNSAKHEKSDFPWGNTFDPKLLNSDESQLGDTTAVGSFPPELNGTLDMAGNVSEWISSLYRPYPYNASDGRENPKSPENREYRGGSWAQTQGKARAIWRQPAPPESAFNELGFRCATS